MFLSLQTRRFKFGWSFAETSQILVPRSGIRVFITANTSFQIWLETWTGKFVVWSGIVAGWSGIVAVSPSWICNKVKCLETQKGVVCLTTQLFTKRHEQLSLWKIQLLINRG